MRWPLFALSVALVVPELAAQAKNPILKEIEAELTGRAFSTRIPVGIAYIYYDTGVGRNLLTWINSTEVGQFGEVSYRANEAVRYDPASPGPVLALRLSGFNIPPSGMAESPVCNWPPKPGSGGMPHPCKTISIPAGTRISVEKVRWGGDKLTLDVPVGLGKPSLTFHFVKGYQAFATRDMILGAVTRILVMESFELGQRTQAEYRELKSQLVGLGWSSPLGGRQAATGEASSSRSGPSMYTSSAPGKYVFAKGKGTRDDYIELRADGTFHVREKGKGFEGRYSVMKGLLVLEAGGRALQATLVDNTIVEQDGTVLQKETSAVPDTAGQEQAVDANKPECVKQTENRKRLREYSGLKPESDIDFCASGILLKNTEALQQVLLAISNKRAEMERRRAGVGEPDSASYARQAGALDSILVPLRSQVRSDRLRDVNQRLEADGRVADSTLSAVQQQKISTVTQADQLASTLEHIRELLQEIEKLQIEKRDLGQPDLPEESARKAQQQHRLDLATASLDKQRLTLGHAQIQGDYRAVERRLTAQRDAYTKAFGGATFAQEGNKLLSLLQQAYENRRSAAASGVTGASEQATMLLREIERIRVQLRGRQ